MYRPSSKLFLTSSYEAEDKQTKGRRLPSKPTLRALDDIPADSMPHSRLYDHLPNISTPIRPRRPQSIRKGEDISLPEIKNIGMDFLKRLKNKHKKKDPVESTLSEDDNGSQLVVRAESALTEAQQQLLDNHKLYVHRKIDTFIEYLMKLEDTHKFSFREFLGNLMSKEMPKYSWLNDIPLREAWSSLERLYRGILGEIQSRITKLEDTEDTMAKVASKHLHLLAEREFILMRIENQIRDKYNDADSIPFTHIQKEARAALDAAEEHMNSIRVDKEYYKRKAAWLLDNKYRSGWRRLDKMTSPLKHSTAKHAIEESQAEGFVGGGRDLWEDLSAFGKYKRGYLSPLERARERRGLAPNGAKPQYSPFNSQPKPFKTKKYAGIDRSKSPQLQEQQKQTEKPQ